MISAIHSYYDKKKDVPSMDTVTCNMSPTTRSISAAKPTIQPSMEKLQKTAAINSEAENVVSEDRILRRRISKPPLRFEDYEIPSIKKPSEKKKKDSVPKDIDTSGDKTNDIRRRYKRWEEAPNHVKSVGFSGSDGELNRYEVEKILEFSCKIDGTEQFFVKWKGWSSIYNNWEPRSNLDSCEKLIDEFKKTYLENLIKRKIKSVPNGESSSSLSHNRISSKDATPDSGSFLEEILSKRSATTIPIPREDEKKARLRRKISPVKTHPAAYPSLKLLRSVLQVTNFEDISEDLRPKEIYGYPVISGVVGVRVRLSDGAVKVVRETDALLHWPEWSGVILSRQ